MRIAHVYLPYSTACAYACVVYEYGNVRRLLFSMRSPCQKKTSTRCMKYTDPEFLQLDVQLRCNDSMRTAQFHRYPPIYHSQRSKFCLRDNVAMLQLPPFLLSFILFIDRSLKREGMKREKARKSRTRLVAGAHADPSVRRGALRTVHSNVST